MKKHRVLSVFSWAPDINYNNVNKDTYMYAGASLKVSIKINIEVPLYYSLVSLIQVLSFSEHMQVNIALFSIHFSLTLGLWMHNVVTIHSLGPCTFAQSGIAT